MGQERVSGKPTFFSGIATLMHGRFLAGQGALPILKGQECLGAAGVSGAKAHEDEEIAQVGINTL
jgi:uncharacterized protein GlcG (DUF336 family)